MTPTSKQAGDGQDGQSQASITPGLPALSPTADNRIEIAMRGGKKNVYNEILARFKNGESVEHITNVARRSIKNLNKQIDKLTAGTSIEPQTVSEDECASLPNLPPKDRDSLEQLREILARIEPGETRVSYPDGSDAIMSNYELAAEEILAWHRYLSTKEMLELIENMPIFDTEFEGEEALSYISGQTRFKKELEAKLRRALTREENQHGLN